MPPKIWLPSESRTRLVELGTPSEVLVKTARAWAIGRNSVSSLAPRTMPGINGWSEGVVELRRGLALQSRGWIPDDTNNFPRVINRRRNVAIAIMRGHGPVGVETLYDQPLTGKRGALIPGLIDVNHVQMSLFDEHSDPEGITRPGPVTWVLLMREAAGVVWCELSLPWTIDVNFRVVGWRERIILGDFDIDGGKMVKPADAEPPVDVPVRRHVAQ